MKVELNVESKSKNHQGGVLDPKLLDPCCKSTLTLEGHEGPDGALETKKILIYNQFLEETTLIEINLSL